MAFIEKIGFYKRFNVSHSVGAGASNWWTDIMLVQYLITTIYVGAMNGSHAWTIRLSDEESADLPDPSHDFKKLKKTEKWIRKFQMDIKGRYVGGHVATDGRVSTARGTLAINGTYYTIQALNDVSSSLYLEHPAADPTYVEWAKNDPSMPGLLKGELYGSHPR